MPHELRDYQQEAVESVFDYFRDGGDGNPLIVAPTGAGKSLIIADFCRRVLTQWPSQRIVVVAHRKELLEQNAQELWEQWPQAPIGIYSAGLRMRQLGRALTIAGIGSLYRRARDVGHVDLLLIDEAHLVPTKGMGMYRSLVEILREQNPNIRVIGLTATPFRLDHGFLHEGDDRLFTDIAYDIDVKMLINRGFLSTLVGKIAVNAADLSNVRVRGGEYVEQDMQQAFSRSDLVSRAVSEMLQYGENRRSWLVFASGVEHAHEVTTELIRRGVSAETVVGGTGSELRSDTVRNFRSGQLRALVNCGVFTTGFNARNVDMIAMLRATQSTGLYVQIMGRGMRTSPETGKENCLVLDFGGNIEHHGPVDQIRIVSRRSGDRDVAELQTAPTKACPSCREAIALACVVCPVCGHIMERETPLHDVTATSASPLSSAEPEELEVFEVTYGVHRKEGKPPSVRVTFHSARNRTVSEWWCFEHGGFATTQARRQWLKSIRPEFLNAPIPETTEEALRRTRELIAPQRVWIKQDGNFERVMSKVFPPVDQLPPLREERPAFQPSTVSFDDDDIPF